jgi:hypothetical protein
MLKSRVTFIQLKAILGYFLAWFQSLQLPSTQSESPLAPKSHASFKACTQLWTAFFIFRSGISYTRISKGLLYRGLISKSLLNPTSNTSWASLSSLNCYVPEVITGHPKLTGPYISLYMSLGVWMMEYLSLVGYLYVRVYIDINDRFERNISASEQRALFQNSMNIRLLTPAVRPRIHKDGLLARCRARHPAVPTDHDSFRLREITTAACKWNNGGWQSVSPQANPMREDGSQRHQHQNTARTEFASSWHINGNAVLWHDARKLKYPCQNRRSLLGNDSVNTFPR